MRWQENMGITKEYDYIIFPHIKNNDSQYIFINWLHLFVFDGGSVQCFVGVIETVTFEKPNLK